MEEFMPKYNESEFSAIEILPQGASKGTEELDLGNNYLTSSNILTSSNYFTEPKDKIIDIQNKGYEATNKESSILDVLYVALEMLARGFKFGNIDLYRSHSKNFVIDADEKTLIPPFRTIDGLGDTVANNIFEEAKKNPFISIEDFSKRCKVSATLVDKMRTMGILKDLPETSQLSLF